MKLSELSIPELMAVSEFIMIQNINNGQAYGKDEKWVATNAEIEKRISQIEFEL